MKTKLEIALQEADAQQTLLHEEWVKSVQAIADKFQVEIATGHMSDVWQVSEPGSDKWLREVYDEHPALDALAALDKATQDYGIGPSNMERFKPTPPAPVTAPAPCSGSYRTEDGKAQIDFGVTHRNGYAEFTASGYGGYSSGQCLNMIKEEYPDDINVKTLHDLWLRYHLQNIGHDVNALAFVREFAASHPERSFYEDQAQTFLDSHGIKLRATLSDSKQCPCSEDYKPHFRVTLSKEGQHDGTHRTRQPSRLAFDFWGQDASAYSVLACISSDLFCPETFADFCAEYGYDEDSRKSLQTFTRANNFSKRLRAFFTEGEGEALSEIR